MRQRWPSLLGTLGLIVATLWLPAGAQGPIRSDVAAIARALFARCSNGQVLVKDSGAPSSVKCDAGGGGGGGALTVSALLPDGAATLGEAAVAARGVITRSGSNPTNGSTVTIGSVTYTFVNSITADNQVKIGANSGETFSFLMRAIQNLGYPSLQDESQITTANPDVIAYSTGSTTFAVVARVAGAAGNSIPLSTTSNVSVSDATLTGGSDGSPFASVAANYAAFGDKATLNEFLSNTLNGRVSSVVTILESDGGGIASGLSVLSPDRSAFTIQVTDGGYVNLTADTAGQDGNAGPGGFNLLTGGSISLTAGTGGALYLGASGNGIFASDDLTIWNQAGTGTEYACFDNTGKLVRSASPCGM